MMHPGVEILGLDGVEKLFQAQGPLFEHNLGAAMVAAAYDAREIVHDATRGPVSGKIASAAEHWQVVPDGKGVALINSDEKAAYLEYGVGIYNEGPGSIRQIEARRNTRYGHATRYFYATGKEAPHFLRFKGKDGRWVFVKKVDGFKGVAMVRNNWPRIKELTQHRILDAVDATLEGRRYA